MKFNFIYFAKNKENTRFCKSKLFNTRNKAINYVKPKIHEKVNEVSFK